MQTIDAQTKRLLNLITSFSDLRVLVIGDAMLDTYLQGATTRLCREAPVPIVDVGEANHVPGGAANTAANVAALGAEAYLLTVVGDDAAGQQLEEALADGGVKLAGVVRSRDRATLVKQRLLADQQLLVRFDQGSTTDLSGRDEEQLLAQLERYFSLCDAVIISDYAYGIITPQVTLALQRLQALHPRILVADSKRLEVYKRLDVTAVKPNYDEAIALLGLPRLSGAARVEQMTRHGQRVLSETGAWMAAITLDRDGVLIFLEDGEGSVGEPTRTLAIPAPNTHATGAGDTYVATLALALAAEADPHGAASLAATATAVVVTEPGTTRCHPLALRRALMEGNKRIMDQTELVSIVAQQRHRGQRIVFTNGCFDILHSGHVTCLERAKALGDVLIVGVNTDDSIRQLKGPTRPVNALADRLTVLAALGCVDYVVPFADLAPRELIRLIRPDVYAKGGDYTRQSLPETPLIEELGGEVVIVPYVGDRSTTGLIQQIRAGDS
ncbi:D-glycero-beta-D-manno-heptose 1-phosphate adenylyltransferase [Nodosilinea sp. LEGE 06152]|uniref:D-glycero-beta-D-manno-heptose 1-phosphate adenylyltransferase n=1 Tax=Nodosilinea sp. LEGE 06152 TaxID=2777966 RepID=UPI00187FF616|nr:D-glycero-beta-D-manno-heptose 1-phosphate adenylyltransferase [Nodosilinea sp. LEGE 06152]MBE9159304.1 D-glycero-beta-D-manno-heptose 1-phosphate adenylyltransferase [Nodosilinea sp. LEGE 06152]